MNQYIVNLNCRVDANTEAEAKTKALTEIRVREAIPSVLTPFTVYELLREFHNKEREFFIALFLDTQNNLLRREVISIGTLNSSLIHPRELFRPAIMANCASIIITHNHPSKSIQPSAEDLAVTKRLVDAGKLLGVEVVDHIIFTTDGYLSFRERNLL